MKLFRVSNSRFVGQTAVLVVADVLVVTMASLLAIGLRFGFNFANVDRVFGAVEPRVAAFAFWMVIGLLSMGLYRARQRPTSAEVIARVSLAVLLGAVANIIFFYVFPDEFVAGRGVVALTMVLAWAGLISSRFVLLRMLDANPVKRRILVIGAGEHAAKIRNLRRRSDRRRFEPVAYVALTVAERETAARLGVSPVVASSEARSFAFDEIVVAVDDRRGLLPMDLLLDFKQRGTQVTDLVDFLERETEYLDLDILRPSWLLYERGSETDLVYRWLKRGCDVVFGVLLLVLASPLLVVSALAIKIEDGLLAPIFYRQKRVGHHGKLVRLYKFRSMRVDAEGNTGPRWSSRSDDRVTRVGRILRRFRIDELPQVINIIRGDMSVVGPRPERPEFVELLAAQMPLYYYRHGVRPGLTGWAQLNFPYGASVDDAMEKLKYDLYYIKNANLVLDLLILVQTLEVVVWGRATTMAGGPRPGDRRGQPEERDKSTRGNSPESDSP